MRVVAVRVEAVRVVAVRVVAVRAVAVRVVGLLAWRKLKPKSGEISLSAFA